MNASLIAKPPVARALLFPDVGWITLTLERSDQQVSILDELLDEFICSLQLHFVAFQALSEVRAVHERVAELQRWESHRLGSRVYVEPKVRLVITELRTDANFCHFQRGAKSCCLSLLTSALNFSAFFFFFPVSETFPKKQRSSDSCWLLDCCPPRFFQ